MGWIQIFKFYYRGSITGVGLTGEGIFQESRGLGNHS